MIYLEYFLLSYFMFCVIYIFCLSLAGIILDGKRVYPVSNRYNRIAVMIPAYQEDGVIVSVSTEALKQDYPSGYYDVIVISDQLKSTTLSELRKLPVNLIEVSFEKSTKTKALNKAMSEIGDDYDIALVLDADNVMETSFLEKINDAFNAGYDVIQSRRVAKNKNTPYAILDALSEIINNHIYRKGPTTLGLSSSLAGSGMAFDYTLFKNTMKSITAVSGFDRELEYELIAQGRKSVYLDHIRVYDHKTDQPKSFSNQRKRWMLSQFLYLKRYFKKGMHSLLKGDLVYFNSTILSNIVLPRILLLGILCMISIISTSFDEYLQLSPLAWWILLGLNILALILAVPANFYNRQFFKATLYLPQIFLIMFLNLFRLKSAKDKFIHTPHEEVKA